MKDGSAGAEQSSGNIFEAWPWLAREGEEWVTRQNGANFSTWSYAGPNRNFSYEHHRANSLLSSEKAPIIKFTINWPLRVNGKTEIAEYRVIYMTEPVVGFRDKTALLDAWHQGGETFMSEVFVLAIRVSGSLNAPSQTPWIQLSHNLIEPGSLIVE